MSLDSIKATTEKATPAPWIVWKYAGRADIVGPTAGALALAHDLRPENAELIVAVVNGLRHILEVIEAAAAVVENDQHIDFGIPPPGYLETHEALHRALLRLQGKDA